MDIIEKILIILLPLFITAFFYSFIPRKLKEREKFIEGSIEFRKTFNKTLVDFRNKSSFSGDHVMSADIFKTHTIAYLNFRCFVSRICRTKYDEAWEQYCTDYENQTDLDDDFRDEIIGDIEDILKFSENRFFHCILLRYNHILRKIRFKLFGPDKKTKEIINKFIKQ